MTSKSSSSLSIVSSLEKMIRNVISHLNFHAGSQETSPNRVKIDNLMQSRFLEQRFSDSFNYQHLEHKFLTGLREDHKSKILYPIITIYSDSGVHEYCPYFLSYSFHRTRLLSLKRSYLKKYTSEVCHKGPGGRKSAKKSVTYYLNDTLQKNVFKNCYIKNLLS